MCSKFPIDVHLTVISGFVYIQQIGIEETIRLLKMKQQQQQVAQMSSSAAPLLSPPPAPTLYSHGRHQQQMQHLGDADVSGLSAALRSTSAAATGFPHSKYVISFSTAASSDCKHSISLIYECLKGLFSSSACLGALLNRYLVNVR